MPEIPLDLVSRGRVSRDYLLLTSAAPPLLPPRAAAAAAGRRFLSLLSYNFISFGALSRNSRPGSAFFMLTVADFALVSKILGRS
jgi:hypothetical protein